ncbi:hypothetical protein D3879_10570 [Pseudomonas cavernicola]|uniref:Uncharacterized protein n=1 Tax=Pseudomonas cavernicola TaxID=2320866 RepID=A0A418XMG6_9PSED|nr:hypothetical protein [Pseudomonas cavernicola]RJG13647.1 hypothetical protein D3879_10570 [Pseudomonas cavernicola]
MPEPSNDEFGAYVAALERGSIIAAADCGKTEQISPCGGMLYRTQAYTHAGVDAISTKLKKLDIPPEKFRVATIVGWCLRFVASFPLRSKTRAEQPNISAEWN